MKPSAKVILVVSVALMILVFFGGWSWFHSIPTADELNRLLGQAEKLEIFRLVDNKPVRWIRLEKSEAWQNLVGAIQFQARYWKFSLPPTDSIVIQTINGDERDLAFEVRGDGNLHIRKAARWYKMPIEPGFEEKVRGILEEKGEDLPSGQQPPESAPAG